MLAQIILHTPVWVWALLMFLIYRGILASADREILLKKTFVIPIVMLGLSVQGIVSTFGINVAAVLPWLACTAAGGIAAWYLFNRDKITANPARGSVFQRGSWMPLVLMMGIFLTKYVVAVFLKFQPDLAHNPLFATGICALYGLFNGAFIGKGLRIAAIYQHAAGKQVQSAVLGMRA